MVPIEAKQREVVSRSLMVPDKAVNVQYIDRRWTDNKQCLCDLSLGILADKVKLYYLQGALHCYCQDEREDTLNTQGGSLQFHVKKTFSNGQSHRSLIFCLHIICQILTLPCATDFLPSICYWMSAYLEGTFSRLCTICVVFGIVIQ